jgi:PAS domain S-box-containing protein
MTDVGYALAISILETFREPALILDKDFCIQLANAACYRKFQITAADVLNRPLNMFGHGGWDHQAVNGLQQAVLSEKAVVENYPVDYVSPTGERKILLLNVRYLPQLDTSDRILVVIEMTPETNGRPPTEYKTPRTESEVRHWSLADQLPLGIYRSARDGQILYANPALAAILEYDSIEELLAISAVDLYADVGERTRRLVDWHPANTAYIDEVVLRTKTGRRIWVRDSGYVTFDKRGQIDHFNGIIEDITERKRSENELQRLNTELEHHNQTLQALYKIGLEINAQLNMSDVPKRIIEQAMILLEGDGSFLYLYDAEAHTLRVKEGAGIWADYVGRTLKPGEGLAGRVFQTAQAMYIDDYYRWEGRSLAYINEPLSAVLSVPLLWRDEVLGTINVTADNRERTFTLDDMRLAEMLASQAAIAIVNARLFETEHRQREIAETLHAIGLILTSALELDETLKFLIQAAQVFFPQAARVSVQLMADDGETMQTFAASAGIPSSQNKVLFRPGQGIAGHAVIERRVINVPDVEADSRFIPGEDGMVFRSLLVSPLISGERFWGTLSITAPTVDAFRPEDENLADLLSRQAAVAIENAQLYDEIHTHVTQLEKRVEDRTAQLQRVKERAEAILTQSSDAIVLAHSDGVIQQTNPAFNDLFGYYVDEAFGYPLISLVDPASIPKLNEILETLLNENRPGRLEVVAQRKDGTTFAADMALSPITEQDERRPNVVCSLRDITTRRQMEENLRNALEKEKQLGEFKSRFGSMVSHEFRTPLAIIQSSSDVLNKYFNRLSDKKRTEHLDIIRMQVKHLNGLLEDILTVSRAETVGLEFRPEPLNIDQFCRLIVDDIRLATPATHQIIFAPTNQCGSTLADEKLLRQSVGNLLTNAVKYSPAGGLVYMEMECQPTEIVIRVRDSGIGIPKEDLQHVFEAFHRADNVGAIPGTGLGLAITKLAVELHGGAIDVESQPGQGTTFTMTIPRIVTA